MDHMTVDHVTMDHVTGSCDCGSCDSGSHDCMCIYGQCDYAWWHHNCTICQLQVVINFSW